MKRYSYSILVLLLFSILQFACKKDEISYKDDYKRSLRAFEDFKKVSNNSYRYMVSNGSWTGFSSETIITVENGIVIGRSYVAKSVDYQLEKTEVHAEWEEDKETLGSHQEGFKPITLDEVYQKAKSEWLPKRKDASVYFESKNDGMMSSCGYVPNGCQDDCFTGVHISYIEKYN